jgi:antitoxin MazE
MMRTKVARWGNSLGVRLPKLIAEDLGLTPGSELELRQDGTRLTLEAAAKQAIPRYRLEDLLAQIKPDQKPPPFENRSAVEPPWPDDDWSDIAPDGAEWAAMKRRAGTKGAKRKRRDRVR